MPADRMLRPTARTWIGLAAILALAAALRLPWPGQTGFGTLYYAAAVRSMGMGWRNFVFAAFDPTGFLAVDKPPVALWLQVVSTLLLGFDGFALHLPQALEGIAAVALLFFLVARLCGPAAGLLAALILALTPISIAIDRSNNTDSCLVLLVLLAAWPLLAAVERGSPRLLLVAAATIGVAFNTKMAAALLVVPAFALVYLMRAPLTWMRRILHLSGAAAVLAAVSLSWPLAVELTPPGARPYVDSTAGNSALELAAGHNALDRFVRPDWLALVRRPQPDPAPPPPPVRVAEPGLAAQVGWLLPLALAGLWLAPGWTARLLWGGWALTCTAVFGAAHGIFLPYYLAIMAPPLAALAAIALTAVRGPRLAAGLIGATVVWQALLLWSQDLAWTLWFGAAALLLSLAGAGLLVARARAGTAAAATGLGVAGLLLAPLPWTTAPLISPTAAATPAARPADTVPPAPAGRAAGAGDGLPNRARLITLLRRDRGQAAWLVATTSITEAAAIIIATGEPVMAIGGYTGMTPNIELEDLAAAVRGGAVRYVLIGGPAARAPGSPMQPLIRWVERNGREVDPVLWRPRPPRAADPRSQRRAAYVSGLRLYDMRPR